MMISVLQDSVLGNPVALWLLAVAAAGSGWLAGRLVVAVLRAVLRPARRPLAQDALARSAPGLRLATLLVGLQGGLSLLDLPPHVAQFLEQGVRFAQVMALAWALTAAVDALHARLATGCAGRTDKVGGSRAAGSAADLRRLSVLRLMVRALVWAAGLATALGTVGVQMSAVLGAIGLVGLALALAAQGLLANLMGGLQVLVQRPFRPGQHIEVAGLSGLVQHVGLHSTTLRDAQDRMLRLPNHLFTRHVLACDDGPEGLHQWLRLRLAPGTPAHKVEQGLAILRDIVTDQPLLLKRCRTGFERIDASHLELCLWFAVAPWSADEGDHLADTHDKRSRALTQIHLAILRRFEAAGIALAGTQPIGAQPAAPRSLSVGELRPESPEVMRQAA